MGLFITFCVPIAIIFILLIIVDIDDGNLSKNICGDLVFTASGIIIALFICLSTTALANSWSSKIDKTYETEIEVVALNDSMSIEGKSFLGSGYINEQLSYYYLEKISDNELKMGHISADLAAIRFDNSNTGKIITIHKVQKPSYFRLIPHEIEEYVIILPENSQIIQNYVIDLQ